MSRTSPAAYAAIFLFALFLSGCAMHRVRWEKGAMSDLEARESPATVVRASLDHVFEDARRNDLPHMTKREKLRRSFQSIERICDAARLGSRDYTIVGVVGVAGNGFANHNTVEKRLSTSAAARGGDVAVVFQSKTSTAVIPGYASTNFYRGGATTTYMPATSIALPSQGAIVLAHREGIARRRAQILRLTDAQLEEFQALQEAYDANEHGSLFAYQDEVLFPALDKMTPGSRFKATRSSLW